MKLTKQNVCVYIENKAQLKEARELLEKHRELIYNKHFDISKTSSFNYLFCDEDKEWWLAANYYKKNEVITMSELETILKEQ